MSDIIDRIDALVDEQMALGETRSDYLNNDPAYPECPHCARHWHGLRITERIANMYSYGRYDEEYSAAEDDSTILCEGSDFTGPQRPSRSRPSIGSYSIGMAVDLSGMERAVNEYTSRVAELLGVNFTFPGLSVPWVRFYDEAFNPLTPERPCTEPVPEVSVEFGPQNWIHELTKLPQLMQFPRNHMYRTPLERAVLGQWKGFTAPTYPIPTSPGYDFDALEKSVTAYGTGPELPPLRKRRTP